MYRIIVSTIYISATKDLPELEKLEILRASFIKVGTNYVLIGS
jgi:hypothetical protein